MDGRALGRAVSGRNRIGLGAYAVTAGNPMGLGAHAVNGRMP